jgi:hypothetical protein
VQTYSACKATNQQQEVFAKAVETLAELREAALDDLVATVDAREQELE